ncbi:hypothetical protein ACRYCC_39645 [Actinomadura scrupuli]|uniref:hypothetical protein n=1 Tax=Actinomadura scrupuli TaxID=559629 RepID=UPI003D98C94D
MSTLTALARIEAARAGRAQPLATVRHCHLAGRPLVVIPLRLAGEAAAPLAVMAGTGPGDATLLVVPQPRNRNLRFAFAAELAEVVLSYVASCRTATEVVTDRAGTPRERYADAPQLLVPNPGAVAFLRLLGRSTRFRRTDGPYPVDASVPLLGRWLTWFADRAERPGTSTLLAMTEVLALHWATGQSSLEDGDLAALLGWIDPPPGLTGAQAALRAEDPVDFPPAGPTTHPGFDNEVLAPALAAYDAAAPPPSGGTARTAAEQRIRDVIAGQLEPTWRLMWRAADLLRALPEAASVPGRLRQDRESFTRFTASLPEGLPQARRDGAVAAAVRLDRMERARAEYDAQRAFDDPLVMAEFRLTGEAFGGVVVECDPARLDESGPRARPRPLVRVRTEDPVRLSPGRTVHNAARPAQEARILELAGDTVLLELCSGMGGAKTPRPGSVPETGDHVCFSAFGGRGFGATSFPEREDTPWTHGGPPREYVPNDDDAQEEWS